MKSRLGALVIFAATSVLILAVAACGDDDDGDQSTAEELTLYFDDIASIQRELSDGIRATFLRWSLACQYGSSGP
jgi:hypothetical protein